MKKYTIEDVIYIAELWEKAKKLNLYYEINESTVDAFLESRDFDRENTKKLMFKKK